MPFSINGSTGISGLNGSASSPAIKGGTSDTGIFFGTDTASVATAGRERLIVDASGNINIDSGGVYYDAANNRLGVGTNSPSSILHVSDGTQSLEINPNSSFVDIKSTNKALRISTTDASDLFLATNNDDRFTILSTGNVGVGDIAPDSTLVTKGTGISDVSFAIKHAWGSSATALMTASNSSNELMRLQRDGKLLVGTSSATAGTTTTTSIIGALLMKSTGLGLVNQGGTLDLDLSEGTGIVGHLYVSSTRESNAAAKTNAVYFISTRLNNNTAITLLNSNNGSTSGSAFTITNPSTNVFRFTDTAAGGNARVSMSFVGTIGF